jgi:regulator of sirC expression with transglutaminase-like and TPR domain
LKDLAEFLAGRTRLGLDHAALLLARCENPGLDPAPFLKMLDSHASELRSRLGPAAGGAEFVAAANRYLFRELGFSGNRADYYNPANSCLNEVLLSRTGLPITLSVVYLSVAARLGRPVFGIGLPGHFVVSYNDGCYQAYIDPFHQGRILDESGCRELVQAAAGVDLSGRPEWLAPVSHRQILQRMINNLRAVYFSRRAHVKALGILDLLLEAYPQAAEEYKQRGMVHLQLNRLGAARNDFESYLALRPEAADRDEIRKQLSLLQRRIAVMN